MKWRSELHHVLLPLNQKHVGRCRRGCHLSRGHSKMATGKILVPGLSARSFPKQIRARRIRVRCEKFTEHPSEIQNLYFVNAVCDCQTLPLSVPEQENH